MNIQNLSKDWDLIVIGGGVTGAGILREAVRSDLKVLLVEQKDFAWGTSSRCSKLVHGGLRYLKEGKPLLTWASVEERERLLKEAEGLVEPLGFLMPIYDDYGPGKWLIETGLSVYDLMAFDRQHQYYNAAEFSLLAPHARADHLMGGFRFSDAQVDDARLVLRLIHEAVDAGGHAVNYTTAKEIIRDENGQVKGVKIADTETGKTHILNTKAVINATGAWAETLHASPKKGLHLRPLRGSHIVFPAWAMPVAQAVSFSHPEDGRPVFASPWEGAVLFGTTDTDHDQDLYGEPVITRQEFDYLMRAARYIFPRLDISDDTCLSTFAGIRPVLSEGNTDPSKESREHVVWTDKGLVTITGGKLTTFRLLAWDALKAARPFLPGVKFKGKGEPVFQLPRHKMNGNGKLNPAQSRRLAGRYGEKSFEILDNADDKNLKTIPGTHTLWAELPFAASENIRHLSDLLLRRVRIGLLTSHGGMAHMARIRQLCEPVLNWGNDRWEQETAMYEDIINSSHALPTHSLTK